MAEQPLFSGLLDYEQTAEQWPDAVMVFDHADHRCLYANDAAERLVGYRRDEIIGLEPADLSHPDDLFLLPSLLEQAQQDGCVRRPWRVRRKDGKLVDTEMTLVPQRVGNRVISQGVLRTMPMDARRRASAVTPSTFTAEAVEVRDADRLQVLEQTGLAIVMVDQGGIITYWNAGAAELYGWPSEAVIGRQVLDLAPDVETKADVKGLMGPPDGRDEWVTQLNVRPRGGDEFAAMVTCSTIRDDDGGLTGFLFVSAPLEAVVRRATPRMRRARVQCAACGREVAGTMRRKYCSEKCRQWAYYHRHLDAQRARSRQRHERQRGGAEPADADATADQIDGTSAGTADQ